MSEVQPTIPQFFNGKNLFLTGGTGFIGKVLIEKILRSCPDVKSICLLSRPKKGKSPTERLEKLTQIPLFDVLREKNPKSLGKLKVVDGDCKELNLGLSSQDMEFLKNEINVVVHAAASVRFDDPLKDQILLNTRGTRELCKLALAMKNLQVIVHISTTYCNTNHSVIDEKLYPAHADWKTAIELAENLTDETLRAMTESYISPLPNTYTFTKSLAEHVFYDMCKGKLPSVVYRPSVVVSTAYDPFPGWIDNFNGPVGLMLAVGKGVVHGVYTDPSLVVDYVPVDLTVRAILISAWKQALSKSKEPSFYNGSNNNVENRTIAEVIEIGMKIVEEIPFDDMLWPPSCKVTKSYYNYLMYAVLFQFLPAFFVDIALRGIGRKPFLFKLQKRIFDATIALSYFTLNQWKFINTKAFHLQDEIRSEDFEDFAYHTQRVTVEEFFKNASLGAKKYFLKESDDTTKAVAHYKRMLLVKKIVTGLFYLFLFWLIFVKFNIISVF